MIEHTLKRFALPLLLAPVLTAVTAAAASSQTPSAATSATAVGASPRVRYSLDDGWRFLPRGQNFAWIASTPDAAWERVNLPHTWNAQDPFDDAPSYRRGVGWYRRTLPLSDALKGKRVFLYFEGANQVADVYVNGAYVCEHRGGYTAFACDVTKQLKLDGKGSENLLAVKVDNSQNPFLPPLSVGYALYGGLYRDVWLVATDAVHFEVTDHASPGVFVSTPSVSRERGEVRVRGTVVNDSTAAAAVVVQSTVTDAAGRVVSEGRREL
ncbi:MAG TPA: hypothetical protein VFL93_07565, partial [Longimicrobiaceae bacterium]|nr:hypothetical protein [Longimicrobiaceae bacterium]